jgi:hypothetical protein
LSEGNIITATDNNRQQVYYFVATGNADESIATLRLRSGYPSASLRVKKTATLSSIKELKVELSVATMILIVQKAGIKKKLKVKTVKNEFISRMTRNDRMPGTKKSKIKKPGNPGFWYKELSLFKAFLL